MAEGQNRHDQVDVLIEQALDLEKRGEFAEARAVYRRALAQMDTADPRRGGIQSAIHNVGRGWQSPNKRPPSESSPVNAPAPAPPAAGLTQRSGRSWTRPLQVALLTLFALVTLLELAALGALGTRFRPALPAATEFATETLPNIASSPVLPTLPALAGAPTLAPVTPVPTLTTAPVVATPVPPTPTVGAPTPSAPTFATPVITMSPFIQVTVVAPTPAVPPVAAPLKSPTPSAPMPTRRPGAVVFEDTFNTGRLNADKWSYDNPRGTLLEWSHGTMRIYSGQRYDAYVASRVNPFPSNGDFRAVIHYRFFRQGPCRAGVGLSTASLFNAAPGAGDVSIVFSKDAVHFSLGAEGQDVPVQLGTSFHEAIVEYVQGRYSIRLDGKPLFASQPTSSRPGVVWFGSPTAMQNNCEWDTLEIQDVRIQTLS